MYKIANNVRALSLVIIGLLAQGSQADVAGKVVQVADGDTVTVLDGSNQQYKVRLTGIDAPERGQPFGTASREHLAALVAGKQVLVESDRRDRYGRLLGKVRVDGLDVNLEQLRAGMAWWYRYYANTQPVADRASYEAAENAARSSGTGLWSEPNPVNPYDWRKGMR